jgi:hypothetical protein
VFLVLVERCLQRCLLRRGVDLDRTAERLHRREQLAGDGADGAVGSERHASRATVAVPGDRLVRAQVELDGEHARPIGSRQRPRLPTANAEQ